MRRFIVYKQQSHFMEIYNNMVPFLTLKCEKYVSMGI